MSIVIAATGVFTPSQSISNVELCVAFNEYVRRYNERNATQIATGELEPLGESSPEMIEKLSGIKSRYVIDKTGLLDPERMVPHIADRPNSDLSLQGEMAVAAGQEAMSRAGWQAGDIDVVIVACSNMQRAYPAIAIEVQQALGITGYAFDMNVACSSATFGIQTAASLITAGQARRVLMVNPEICSGHLEWRDRDCHFIFGDVCTAVLLGHEREVAEGQGFAIVDSVLSTQFSSNIRNNRGFLNRCDESHANDRDKLFMQEGRKVFKEVCPMVAEIISSQLARLGLGHPKRLWLHQANINMNDLIVRRVLGRDALPEEAPVILDRYANTSSAGSVVALHLYHEDLQRGDVGVLCSFGAGYSIGSVIVRKR